MTLVERARKLKEFSPLIKDREKLETAKIVGQTLTIADFDIATKRGEDKSFAVVVFKEYPDNFIFAASVLTDLLADLAAQLEAENLDLHKTLEEDPLRIQLVTRTSRSSGRSYTDVEIVDDVPFEETPPEKKA